MLKPTAAKGKSRIPCHKLEQKKTKFNKLWPQQEAHLTKEVFEAWPNLFHKTTSPTLIENLKKDSFLVKNSLIYFKAGLRYAIFLSQETKSINKEPLLKQYET